MSLKRRYEEVSQLEEALDLCSNPIKSNPIAYTTETTATPNYSLDNDGPICFTISTARGEFLDLSKIFLTLSVQVLESDGGKLPDTPEYGIKHPPPKVSIPCNFFDALIHQLKIKINGQAIGGSAPDRAQASMLKQLVSLNYGYSDNILKSSVVWKKDIGDSYRDDVGQDSIPLH